MQLRFDNITDFYDVFDGKSFRLEEHSGGANSLVLINSNIAGFSDSRFSHCFNVRFKLSSIALGSQPILEYGGDTSNQSSIVFNFLQVGDTDKFIPNIETHIHFSRPKNIVTLPAITRNEWCFISYSRDVINKVVNIAINGEAFTRQSHTEDMNITALSRLKMYLGGVEFTNSASLRSQSSVGNFSLFDRPLKLKEVKSIFDLDKGLYEPKIIITPQTFDRRIRPSLKTGITTEFDFKESVKNNISEVTVSGTDYISNDGFIEVVRGTYMEVVEPLPSYILDSNNNHSCVIQFRSINTVNNSFKMALTTSPASTSSFSDFTGLRLAGTNLNVSAIYYKGIGDILVSAEYTLPPDTDLSVGIHQVITTFNKFSNTLKIYFDNEEPITSIALTNDPILYSADSTIVLNNLTRFFPPEMVEYHKVASYNRVLSKTDVDNLYNVLNQVIITPPAGPTIDPNLLFDVNFDDSSLDVDYTIDGSALVFEPRDASGVTAEDGFVTIITPNYIKLTTGLPEYLKNTGDQSWVVNWRSETTSAHNLSYKQQNQIKASNYL
jgi:hypothetical protein